MGIRRIDGFVSLVGLVVIGVDRRRVIESFPVLIVNRAFAALSFAYSFLFLWE